MIPLKDDNPTSTTPIVVYALIALNIALFIHEFSLSAPQILQFFQDWAVIPRQLVSSPGQEWITILSSQFLHGGILHLLGNMWFLWIFGNNIEDCLGSVKFLCFYLLCGAIAAVSQVVFSTGSTVPMIGASGAIAGVMGAYIIKYPKAQILTLVPIFILITFVRVPAIFFLGLWLAGQTVYAFMSTAGQEGVAYLAHVGGFIAGLLLLKLFDRSSSTDFRS